MLEQVIDVQRPERVGQLAAVHPEWLLRQRIPGESDGETFWRDRYEDINTFERHLDRNGTKVIKFFLHVSKAEQKRRFLARLDTPGKEWKFKASDVTERSHWDAYMQAFDDAITATSTPWAPWYVIPADNKSVMQAMVARLLVEAVSSLELSWPQVSEEDRSAHAQARQMLDAEDDDEPRRG
jgi:polyphosphate kinase 2 (PPK2 family)